MLSRKHQQLSEFDNLYLNQLQARHKTPQEIMEEYERLRKENEEKLLQQKTNPKVNVTSNMTWVCYYIKIKEANFSLWSSWMLFSGFDNSRCWCYRRLRTIFHRLVSFCCGSCQWRWINCEFKFLFFLVEPNLFL